VVPALYVEARPQPRLIASTEAGVRVLALRAAPQPAKERELSPTTPREHPDWRTVP
jgi:hypothetical protein